MYDWATSHGRPPFCNWRISPSSERLQSQMLLYRFDVSSLSIMSGRNNMRYKCYRMCFGMHVESVRFGCKLCNRSLGAHEPKWTFRVKRPSDVAQSCLLALLRHTFLSTSTADIAWSTCCLCSRLVALCSGNLLQFWKHKFNASG